MIVYANLWLLTRLNHGHPARLNTQKDALPTTSKPVPDLLNSPKPHEPRYLWLLSKVFLAQSNCPPLRELAHASVVALWRHIPWTATLAIQLPRDVGGPPRLSTSFKASRRSMHI